MDPELESQRQYFEELYTKGIEWFNENFGTPSEDTDIPKLEPQDFEGWYRKLFNDLYKNRKGVIIDGELDTSRLNKIIQYGNFGVSQPTGGFVLNGYISKEFIKDQYKNAIKNDTPVLMVITEPFTQSFFNNDGTVVPDVNYKIIDGTEKCGLLYNDSFKAAYSIESFSRGLYKYDPKDTSDKVELPEVLTMTGTSGFILVSKVDKEPIFIVNFHGDSKGNVDQFKDFIENSKRDKVHFITGDSNVTMAKTKKKPTTTQEVLEDKCRGAPIACSTQMVSKERFKLDILLNNQVNKFGGTSEIDGMFAVDLNTYPTSEVSEVIWKQTDKRVTAFETPYSQDNPMLGDHSVVGLNVTVKVPFTLLSATGSLMDDPTNGVFGDTDKWGNVRIKEFHEKVGENYTIGWLHIYNTWKEREDKKSFKSYVKSKNAILKVLIDLDEEMEKIIPAKNIVEKIKSLSFFNKPANRSNNAANRSNNAANRSNNAANRSNNAANGQTVPRIGQTMPRIGQTNAANGQTNAANGQTNAANGQMSKNQNSAANVPNSAANVPNSAANVISKKNKVPFNSKYTFLLRNLREKKEKEKEKEKQSERGLFGRTYNRLRFRGGRKTRKKRKTKRR